MYDRYFIVCKLYLYKVINTFQSTSVNIQTKLLLIPLCAFFSNDFLCIFMCTYLFTQKYGVIFWSSIMGFYRFLLFTLLPGSRFYHYNQLLPQSLLHNTQGRKLLWGEMGSYFYFYSLQDLVIDNLTTIAHSLGRVLPYKCWITTFAIKI